MRNSLKKRLFAHLYSILVISCTFGLVQKKTFLLFLCGFLLILQEKFRLRSLTKINELLFFFVHN
jgi:hypothetical protein